MIGMYAFMLSLSWKKLLEISHTHGKLYICAGLDFGNSSVFNYHNCKTKQETMCGCNYHHYHHHHHHQKQREILNHFINHSHLFLNYIRLIWLRPLMIQMMWSINFRGRGAYGSEIYQNWLHHHQEEMRWLKLVLTLGCLADKRVDQWGLVDALTLCHPS